VNRFPHGLPWAYAASVYRSILNRWGHQASVMSAFTVDGTSGYGVHA
jgi:hypothetical protein